MSENVKKDSETYPHEILISITSEGYATVQSKGFKGPDEVRKVLAELSGMELIKEENNG